MKSFGISDKGRYRSENQDSFSTKPVEGGVLAVVCDGMGGAAAGRLASEMAISRFVTYVSMELASPESMVIDDILRLATGAANREIYHHSLNNEECAGMGTTLVGGYFRETEATIVNVGDSRAYRISLDGIFQLTKDHSLVQRMVDSGQLTPAQARRHPRRNIITRAVGSEPFVTSDIFVFPVRKGDIFLLCSDGLSNAVEEAEIHRLILASENVETACRSLIDAALANNARDNITAVVIDPVEGGGERG